MPWTSITNPLQGDPTRKSIIDTIIANLAYLFGRSNSVTTILNPSFEDDTDSDGIPDGWTRTLFSGGTFLRDNTDQQSGLYSVKFTSPGGASNGGGYIENTDAFPVSPNRAVEVLWEMKSSAAGVSNRVEIFWFKSDLTASATTSTSIYNSTTNPTSWVGKSSQAVPPSDARFAKVRLTGCHTASTTAGSTWFDNTQIRLPDFIIPTIEVLTTSGNWTCPGGVYFVQAECWGGGGGGGGVASKTDPSIASGGGGEYTTAKLPVVPGNVYAYTVGVGGALALGAGGIGGTGGTTDFGGLITAIGGGGGDSSIHVGGAGGTGGTGSTFSIQGQDGGNGSLSGGDSPRGGYGGKPDGNGRVPGGGGGASGGSSPGNGANGRIVLQY